VRIRSFSTPFNRVPLFNGESRKRPDLTETARIPAHVSLRRTIKDLGLRLQQDAGGSRYLDL
jgi:hypothetical protein